MKRPVRARAPTASANFSAGKRPYWGEEVRGRADPTVGLRDVQHVETVGSDAVDEPLHVGGLLLGPDVDASAEVVLDGDQQVRFLVGHDVVVEGRTGVLLGG